MNTIDESQITDAQLAEWLKGKECRLGHLPWSLPFVFKDGMVLSSGEAVLIDANYASSKDCCCILNLHFARQLKVGPWAEIKDMQDAPTCKDCGGEGAIPVNQFQAEELTKDEEMQPFGWLRFVPIADGQKKQAGCQYRKRIAPAEERHCSPGSWPAANDDLHPPKQFEVVKNQPPQVQWRKVASGSMPMPDEVCWWWFGFNTPRYVGRTQVGRWSDWRDTEKPIFWATIPPIAGPQEGAAS